MSDISLGLSRFTGFPGRCRLGPGKSALTVLSKVLSASYVETEVGQRLPTRECAISRSDGRQERGIAFPATSLLSFLVAQERKCPRGTGGRRKNKRPSATDITIKPTVICRESQPAETVNEHRERAGLRRARLRPARPKGRKTCPGHLTVQLLQGQIPEEAQIVTVRPARPQISPLTIRSLKSRRLRRTPHSRQLPRNRQRASSRYCFRIPP